MCDENLVHAVIDEKDLGGRDLDSGPAELNVNLRSTIDVWSCGHGSLILDL